MKREKAIKNVSSGLYKQLTITLPMFVYDEYLEGVRSNKSAFVTQMFVKGMKTELGDNEANTARLVKLIQEVKNKDDEIKNLKLQVGSLKQKLNKEPAEETKEAIAKREELEKIADGIKANNPLRDME